MAGTIHGNVNCVVGTAVTGKTVSHTLFKNTFDLLTSLTSSGTISRIAYNTGSFGSGTGYADEADTFGRNAWGLFRFNTSSVRTWEWYFLIQTTSGSGNFGDAPGNPGLTSGIGESQSGNEGSVGIAAATMLTTGGVDVSPWNGTTNNDGTDTKGDPVWSGSLADATGDRLAVLPRSNNAGGSHDTSRENMAELYNSSTINLTYKFHILVDDDSIAFFGTQLDDGKYSCNYVGTYEPRAEISDTVFTPLVMFVGDMDIANVLNDVESFGSTAGNNPTWEGGLVISGAVTVGRTARYDVNWQESVIFQPNTAISPPQHDIFSIPLLVYEAPTFGHVGYINTPIYQEIYNVDCHTMNKTGNRIVFGDNTAKNIVKIFTSWNSSVPAPGVSFSRTGSLF